MTESSSLRPATSLTAAPLERLLGRRNAAGPETPFLLPDDGGASRRGPLSRERGDSPSYNLAEHLSAPPDKGKDAGPCIDAAKEAAAVDSRHVSTRRSAPKGRKADDGTALPPVVEKAAANPIATLERPASGGTIRTGRSSFVAKEQRVMTAVKGPGTGAARTDAAMLRLFLRKQVSSAMTVVQAMHPAKPEVVARAHALQDAHRPRRRDEDRRELRHEAAAMQNRPEAAVADRQAAPLRETASTPQLEELPPLILDHLERLRQAGQNTLCVALKLADGTPLDMRLHWRGGRVVAQFASGAAGLRHEIERAWGQLVRDAGSQGMRLEPPEFQDAPFSSIATA